MNWVFKILQTLYIISFATSIYIFYLLTKRYIINKVFDKLLSIKTTGHRSWGKYSLYNRAESTPYQALISLHNNYKVKATDKLVDFGCGKGRVAIFMHNKFNVSVTGIELHNITYNDAINNVESYFDKHGFTDKELFIKKEYAEKYEIGENENLFFFFNPFDVSIFKMVVNNIIKSSNIHNKSVDIILYYPLKSYINFLSKSTSFELIKGINYKCSIGFKAKFLIYRHTPKLPSTGSLS